MFQEEEYDVLIIGSGLAGATAAVCLESEGVRTLVVDAARHPRFAIGESTIPVTSTLYELLADKHNVPELAHLSSFEGLIANVGKRSGLKNNFGFVHHTQTDKNQSNDLTAFQFPLSHIVSTEAHWYREEVDQWLTNLARHYGAIVYEGTTIDSLDVDAEDAVSAELSDGRKVKAKYCIDSSGRGSLLAKQKQLRTTEGLKTHSYSIFSHMVGVKPFDDVADCHTKKPWHEGTLHHLFEGGWMWVIPFDNHADATSKICSVGISLSSETIDTAQSPEDLFKTFLSNHPIIAEQFAGATAVRPWVKTGRLQYTASEVAGPRWCLTSNAAGFIDALFSRGMQNTTVFLIELLEHVIAAVRENNFKNRNKISELNELHHSLISENDYLVSNAYASFSHADTWNAWFRVWQANQIMSSMRARATLSATRGSTDSTPNTPWHSQHLGYGRSFFKRAGELMQDYRKTKDSRAAKLAFKGLFDDVDFIPPSFGIMSMDQRTIDIDSSNVDEARAWATSDAPLQVRDLYLAGLGSHNSNIRK